MPSKDEREASLKQKLEELHTASNGFPIVLAHGVPDYVLLQFAFDVFEQAGATLLVAAGPSPRAAAANARAAFEAALDMYALVAEPSSYDEKGAFVRVCELLAKEDLRTHRARACEAVGVPPPVDNNMTTEEIVTKEAIAWESDQQGVTSMYQRTLAQAREDKRWKQHWSGLGNYVALSQYVENKCGAFPGFKETAVMWYRALTNQSHPGPRTGARIVARDAGKLSFGPRSGDEALPLAMATVSCEHAIDALRLRREMFRSAKFDVA